MSWISDPNLWLSFLTLTVLEIVLGIDNLIFVSILSGRLPRGQQSRGRRIGLLLAVISRTVLLLSLSWVMRFDRPFWSGNILGQTLETSPKDVILMVGGCFLIFKSTREIHAKFEATVHRPESTYRTPSITQVVLQIFLLDVVFSLDSVITAVGMANQVGVMIAAVIAAMGVMVTAADAVSALVERHPTIKMLALAFLIMIGTLLVAEGLHQHISKGYVYFAMAFSAVVEGFNIRLRSKQSTDQSLPPESSEGP